jgi:hypothetical protein
MRAGRSAACPPAGSGRCHCGVWKYPWGPDGIFVYGGAHCYPAGVSPWTSPLCQGIHEVSRFFHRTFTKNFGDLFHSFSIEQRDVAFPLSSASTRPMTDLRNLTHTTARNALCRGSPSWFGYVAGADNGRGGWRGVRSFFERVGFVAR